MDSATARQAVENLYLPTRALNMPADQHELMTRSRDALQQVIADNLALADENQNLRAQLKAARTSTPEAAP